MKELNINEMKSIEGGTGLTSSMLTAIYKTLEGKVSSYSDITNKKGLYISKDNLINKEEGI